MINPSPKTGPLLFLQHSSIFECYGGIQYYVDDFLNLLSTLYGAEKLKVLLAHRSKDIKLQSRPYSIEPVQLSQGIFKKLENRFSRKLFFRALSQIRASNPSVIIVSHVALAPMAAILSSLTSTPFMVIAYGTDVWGKFQPQDKWALKRADGIISISHWTKTILEKQGFAGEKIQIVHPTVTSEMLKTSHLRSDTDPSRLKLLTVSRLDSSEKYKGHDHVLQALKLLKESTNPLPIDYTIQGTGNDLSRLQQLVEDYELQSSVTFIPHVKTREDLKDIYQSHDVFIMPSRFGFWNNSWKGEGFGIVYVEAALFGVPSVAYECGGVTDIIENGKNGILVEPDNIKALAQAIVALAQDKQKIRELGNKAREMALQKFTAKSIEQEMKIAFRAYPFWKLEPFLS